MEIPSKQAIRQMVQSFNLVDVERYTAAIRAEHLHWESHFAPTAGLLSSNMPLGKRIRLCLEAILIEPLSPLFRERIENQQVMMRWALSTVSTVVHEQTSPLDETSYASTPSAIAFDIIGLELAKEVLDDYLLTLAKTISTILLHYPSSSNNFYEILADLYHQAPLRQAHPHLAALQDHDLSACFIFIWLNEIESITQTFAGKRGGRYRIQFTNEVSTDSEFDIDADVQQRFLQSPIRHSIASGFGTAFQLSGVYAEILLEASQAYDLPISAILEDESLFDKIGELLVKQASLNIDAIVMFKDEVSYYKIDYTRQGTYRIDSVLRMADLLPQYNYLAFLSQRYPMNLFTEAEIVHINEKIIASLYQTYDFPKVYSYLKTSPKGDRQIIDAFLTILDVWVSYLNQSYVIFTKYLVNQTGLDFKNSELCPQLQIRVDDELGIQYFYRHIVLPTMKRVLAFSQLNSYNQS